MSAAIISNILVAIQLCLVIWHMYLIICFDRIIRKQSTSLAVARDNNVFSDLRMDEKYHPFVSQKKENTLRKPVTRSDVELWEQEKADLSKK